MLGVCLPWWVEAPSIPSLGNILTRDQIIYLLLSFFCEPLHSCLCVYLNSARITVTFLHPKNLNTNMPDRKSHRSKKRTPKQESPVRSNGSSGPSKVNCQELEARMAFPMPSREASVDCSEVSLNGDVQDPENIDLGQEQVSKVVRNPVQNHDRMDSARRYCLLTMVHKATHRGCRALSKPMWNPASITNMMSDDLDITEVVVLDHIMAILYVG